MSIKLTDLSQTAMHLATEKKFVLVETGRGSGAMNLRFRSLSVFPQQDTAQVTAK
jgi:hypothetical protein